MKENNYIVIEGLIGVGKTALAKLLAEKLEARLILEDSEGNPFLKDFYKDRERYAFQAQIFFLLSRFRQQQELLEYDLFAQRIVTDYLFAKDKIFASVVLDEKEFHLYGKLISYLERNISKPDLVIYLQSTPEKLFQKIKERGKEYEKEIELNYLLDLNEAYNRYFFHYKETPLLVINTDNFDFLKEESDLKDLLEKIKNPHTGTKYYTRG
ncbi:MAG: deoxynucleoside kinase [Candidatus Zixiibacteriota bacterium]